MDGPSAPETLVKEPLRRQETAFMFDVDGVLTNPDTKEVNPHLLQFLADKLNRGEATALITGRAFSWVEKRVITDLQKLVTEEGALDNLFVSTEHGVSNFYYENGVLMHKVDESLAIPSEINTQVQKKVAEVNDKRIFFDTDKTTMSSIEIVGSSDSNEVKEQKKVLDIIENDIRPLFEGHPELRVLRSEIALDVLHRNAGKDVAAKAFLDYLKVKGVEAKSFVMFGDSPTDSEASDYLHQQNKSVRFAYVGKKTLTEKPYEVLRAPRLRFDEAAETIIHRYFSEFELPEPVFWAEDFSILALNPDGFEIEVDRSLSRSQKLAVDYPKSQLKEPSAQEASFLKKKGLEFTPKVGLRNIHFENGRIIIDIKPVTFPEYVTMGEVGGLGDLLQSLEVAGGSATAMILATTEKDGTSKIILQHRSEKNRVYGDIPGASAAGLLDGKFSEEKKGTLEPITTSSIIAGAKKELVEEIGVPADSLESLRINSLTLDGRHIHYEFTLFGKTKLSKDEIISNKANAQSQDEKRTHFDFDEKFFVIDGTPVAIEKLLTEVLCPLPPTHAAAFIAAGYTLVAEKNGINEASQWLKALEPKVTANYKAINNLVNIYHQSNEDLEYSRGYDPKVLPQNQGLPGVESELKRVGLLN